MHFRLFRRLISTSADISKVRNIGIIAHIDAGKTTTTERMLYYSGKTNRIGNVDQGDTITDFLPQERTRGITIQSAAISFNWQKLYNINLIDTPGHADFTFEVIRSLKVLDGCVTILDAVAGVEAQTEKVWKQSKGVPKLCFINKMDRVGAGYSRTVKELMIKMKTRPLLINTPIFKTDTDTKQLVFAGVLDVVNAKQLTWDLNDPDKIEVSSITEDHDCYEELVKCRESLVETLSEVDETLVEYFLEAADGDYLKVPPDILNKGIRDATLAHYATPILCGASFKNIGVQPLLDAIVNYLPSPLEAKVPEFNRKDVPIHSDPKMGILINNNSNLCIAMAFKVITDAIRGTMIFIRVYSGVLNSGYTVYNSTTNVKFKLGKLVRMHANVPEEIKSLYPGELGVLVGSNVSEHVRTGDTILAHTTKKDGLRSLNKNTELTLRIHPIEIPPPVFSVAIEPKTLGNKAAMDESLSQICREDPSLVVTRDEETGQTLLNGMGELHLEIATDRLLKEFKAAISVGKVVVSYKETISAKSEAKTVSTEDGYSLTIQVEPLDQISKERPQKGESWYPLGDNNYLVMEKHHKYHKNNWPFQIPYESIINALIPSCIVGLQKGGKICNFPLHSCVVRISGNWEIPTDSTSVSPILHLSRSIIVSSFNNFPENCYSILEPIMDLEVITQQQDLGNVVQDLSSARNANILSIEDEHDWGSNLNLGNTSNSFNEIAKRQYLPSDPTLLLAKINEEAQINKVIRARAPLREMVSYMNKLRMLTKGRGSIHMDYWGMELASQDRIRDILRDL
ncbi:mitochondrial elongation factor MEF2 Ecym_6351 [Eremothecium cymbalariae DBVPG|uniref:Ribosome-releasing factor 2, mitochondrial n=1 Tax=Eremothecium cymbalariae (strain CBS 270.75 / DBVPG 7215 / KCTC 17166 / NRRL Y-17582) TaxID=931890 RepID=G8JUE7_ERECY|nr:hypothetical protein Ecym_6351 [Eremothecium cymbalariae DBVPG\